MKPARKLLYIPVVHDPWSEYDEDLREASFGPNPDENLVRQFREGLKRYWDRVDKALSKVEIDRVYQDACYDWFGLDFYLDYYRKDAAESRNFRTLCSLLDRGAQLMITESNDARNQNFSAKDPVIRNLPRDLFVAANIDSTLQEGETGVLFMGVNHKVYEILRGNYPGVTVGRFNGNPIPLLEIIEKLKRDYQQSQADKNET